MSPNEIISIVIFLLVMVAIVSEKVHRAAASLAGAVILLATHVLTVDSAIEHVTAATQENSAGIAEIDKMVARIHTLAKQLQDGLAM